MVSLTIQEGHGNPLPVAGRAAKTDDSRLSFTRRKFIGFGTAAVAGAILPARLQGAAGGAALSLGFGLYGMKSVPLLEAFDHCARIGYGNIQPCLDPGFSADPARFAPAARQEARRRLADLGLTVSAPMRNGNLFGSEAVQAANLEGIKAAVAVAKDLAIPAVAPIESILGGKTPEWEGGKQRAAERLRAWGETAAAEGGSIVVKAHAGQAVDSPAKLLWLLREAGSPAVEIDYDHSHFELAGYSLEDSLRTLAPHIRFVTIKDSNRNPKDIHFLLPGDGQTDFLRYFRLLREIGYGGPAVVEVSSQISRRPGYDPVAAARRCYNALAPALRAAEAAR